MKDKINECHKALGSALSRQEEYVLILNYININICYHLNDSETIAPIDDSILLYVKQYPGKFL